MTYRRFHLVFTLPVLLALASMIEWTGSWALYGSTTLILLAIVMVFTSPWDNYAVARGIWDFPSDRVWFRIKHLPVEEYAFFVIQSLQVIGLCILLIQQTGIAERTAESGSPAPWQWMASGVVVVLWLIVGRKGRGIHERSPSLHYAWPLLYWFLPVIVLQWVIAGDILWLERWPIILLPTLGIGTYLSLADYYAVGQGIWFFDRKQITGRYIAGILPWEEVAFFYLTSLLVSQSFVMLLPDAAR
jgi:lycopene cyclase domain-containing protein